MTDFWAGRRVLVTGHTGFKGGWLALWLQRLGAEVTGFSAPPPTEPALFELARVGELVADVRGDVRDARAVADAVAGARPEIVLHLAAQPVVRRAWREPAEAYAVNTLGTVHVLDAVHAHARDAAVVVDHQRQVLRRPRQRAPLPRGRPARRHGPLLGLQGRGRARHRLLPRRPRAARRHGARGQRDRRRRLGGGPDRARRRARRPGRARRSRSATRARCARGSTCSTRSTATSCSPSGSPARTSSRARGTSPRRSRPRSARSAGSSSASRPRWGGRCRRRRRAPRRPAGGGAARAGSHARGRAPRLAGAVAARAGRRRGGGVVPAGGVRG